MFGTSQYAKPREKIAVISAEAKPRVSYFPKINNTWICMKYAQNFLSAHVYTSRSSIIWVVRTEFVTSN